MWSREVHGTGAAVECFGGQTCDPERQSGSDLTSIYMVRGVGHPHMIYPKGFRQGGIEMEDLG